MATKSLGTLTVDMLLQTAGFEAGMEKAERIANQRTRRIEQQAIERAKAIETAWGNMARSMAAPLAGAISIAGISGIVSSLAQAQQQADKLRNSLNYSTGNATRELSYLRETAQRLGVDFTSAATAYAKFAAATKGTGISADQTREVFEGVAAASSKMGLSAEETQGALLALSQMASKGKVSAEELRGQLGERLPGALKLAAQAMGVTQAELGKMMESGQLLANDFLPKFGRVLKEEFAGSVTGLTQEINRMNSAWDIWKQSLANSDGGGFRWITNGLSESSAAMRKLGEEAGITHKILVAIGGFQAGALGAGKFDTQATQQQAFRELADLRRQRQELEAQQEKYSSLPPITQNRLDTLRREESELRAKINRLAVLRGKESGMQLPDLAGEYYAQKAKADERLKAYLGDTANAPKAAKIAAAVQKENEAFQAAVTGLSETDERYIKALKSHNQRIAEISKGGESKEKISEGQRLIDQMQQRLATVQHLSEVEKLELELSEKKYSKTLPGERDIALNLAQQIDYRAEIAKQLDEEINAARELSRLYEQQENRLKQLIGNTDSGKNVQRLQDEALAESALRSGQIDPSTYDQIIAKLREVKDEGKDTFSELQQAIEGWGRASADAMVEFALTGKASFSDLASSILKDVAKMIVYQNITKPLASGISDWASGLFKSADGNVFSGSPSLHRYVNTVQTTPQVFGFNTLHGFASGGVFAEEGPEAVMPLKRDNAGRLGVSGSGRGVQVIINNNAPGTEATQTTRSDRNGNTIIEVVVAEISNRISNDIRRGSGEVPAAMEHTYGLNRAMGSYR